MTVTFSPSTDFEDVVDCLESATIAALDATTTAITKALRREQANGDVVWHIPVAQHASRPEEGATITDAQGRSLPVREAQHQACGNRWRVTCGVAGNTITEDELDTTVRIDDAIYQKDEHGASKPRFIGWKSDVAAKILGREVTTDTTSGARLSIATHDIYLKPDAGLDTNKRIVGADNTIYRIVNIKSPDPPTGLIQVEAEVTPWPLA